MKTILIADDSPLTRNLLRLAFAAAPRGKDLAVVEAADGAEALAALLCREVALIVCDLEMPRLSGHTLLSRVRALPLHHHTPFVVLSSLVHPAMEAQLRALGATRVLKKPLRADHVDGLLRLVARETVLDRART
jgi:CheY-like chemotaxis protein